MTQAPARIPLSVLLQALGLASIVGIPVLFVAINQVRRACGNGLFGTRQHFCSAAELASWLPTLSGWILGTAGVILVGGALLARRFLRTIAS